MAIRFAGFVQFVVVLSLMTGCGGGGTAPADGTKPPPVTTQAPVASVTVALSAPSVTVGQTVQATVTTRNAVGGELTGRAVTWSSATLGVATVSSAGLVTAVAAGTTQITATSEGVSGAQTFTALAVAAIVDSVVLSLDSAEVIVGDTLRIVAVPRDAAGRAIAGVKLNWSSSNLAVATVSPTGLVTVLDMGDAVIDVSVAAAAAANVRNLSVEAATVRGGGRSRIRIFGVPVVTITPGSKTIDLGETVAYTARVTDTKGALLNRAPAIVWRSTSGGVATVNQSGLATAVKKGATRITATINTGIAHEYSPTSVPLLVTVCGGLIDMTTWSATVSSELVATNPENLFNSVITFNVNQKSFGTANLTRLSIDANGENAMWQGAVLGTGHINNRSDQVENVTGKNIGTITEIGDGALAPSAYVRLSARWIAGERTCRYSVQFLDGVTYVHRETPKPPGMDYTLGGAPGGLAAALNKLADTKPADGWHFNGTVDAPGMLFPGEDDNVVDLTLIYYQPISSIAGAMMSLRPGSQFGTGKFTYTLVGH